MYQTIKDNRGHQLKYLLNLSKEPIGCPLLVVLHGYGSKSTQFRYEGWNVLAPYDDFAHQNQGSWWLGESRDFFVKELLQRLIKETSQKYQSEKKIYFYGSSMGGYGAILHGILCNARAVYANVPQIQLSSTYFSFFPEHFKAIWGENRELSKEGNLVNYLNSDDNFPIFFLCENMIEESRHLKNYLQENTLLFANRCYEYQLKLHLELLPYEGHTKNYGLKEVLQKFEQFAPARKDLDFLVENYFLLDCNNWFLNKDRMVKKNDFNRNSLVLKTHTLKSKEIIYLSSASSNIKNMGNRGEDYFILGQKESDFTIEVEKMDNCEVSFFIMEFITNSQRVVGKAYRLEKGLNSISHTLNSKSKYLKMAFRLLILKNGTASFDIKTFGIKFFK